MHHEERHVVSNAIGSSEMHIDVGPPVRLAARDTVLLASDGLFDNLLMKEIVAIVRKGPLERVVRDLADGALARMGGGRRRRPLEAGRPDLHRLSADRETIGSMSGAEGLPGGAGIQGLGETLIRRDPCGCP